MVEVCHHPLCDSKTGRLLAPVCHSCWLTLGAENQPLEFRRKQSMRLCGCSNGKWLVQLEVILVTCALCWSAPENCRREIPHGAVRSVEMTLPFCPHAGKPKVIATSLINETPKGDWLFCFFFTFYMCFPKCLQALNGIQHIIEMLMVIFSLSVSGTMLWPYWRVLC